jgi:hypothetical protein
MDLIMGVIPRCSGCSSGVNCLFQATAFRARPRQKARMTKLPWLLFQLAIIGAWLCLDYGTSHRGAPPNPGLALAMGVATAFILTAIPLGMWRGLKQPS